jgi:hypothetical protein
MSLPPEPVEAARDELARAAEAEHPGWMIRHGLYGWTGTRIRDQRTERAESLPLLTALISVADSDPEPWTADRAAALLQPQQPDDTTPKARP